MGPVVLLLVMGAVAGMFAGRGHAQTGPLPPGHPPMGRPQPGPSVIAPPAGGGTGSQALVWTAPSGWTKEAPSSAMRRAQYRIPGSAGAGEMVVFYFGPGQGGDAKANVARWVSQFQRPDGKPVGDAFKTREIKVGDIPVVTVEVAGTYVGGMGGGPTAGAQPNYMLLGAVAEGPDASWFFRATGPRATLAEQRGAFDTMIRSIKRGQ